MERKQEAAEFFGGNPEELLLFQTLEQAVGGCFPQAEERVQKSQVAFWTEHPFCYAWLPFRRVRNRPEHCIVVTFGLGERLVSPRILEAVEPYPGRWTHHTLLSAPEQVDEELLAWITWSEYFSRNKPKRRRAHGAAE